MLSQVHTDRGTNGESNFVLHLPFVDAFHRDVSCQLTPLWKGQVEFALNSGKVVEERAAPVVWGTGISVYDPLVDWEHRGFAGFSCPSLVASAVPGFPCACAVATAHQTAAPSHWTVFGTRLGQVRSVAVTASVLSTLAIVVALIRALQGESQA